MPLFGETEPVIGSTHYSYVHNYTCIVPINVENFKLYYNTNIHVLAQRASLLQYQFLF